jgi:hypothetical protein
MPYGIQDASLGATVAGQMRISARALKRDQRNAKMGVAIEAKALRGDGVEFPEALPAVTARLRHFKQWAELNSGFYKYFEWPLIFSRPVRISKRQLLREPRTLDHQPSSLALLLFFSFSRALNPVSCVFIF